MELQARPLKLRMVFMVYFAHLGSVPQNINKIIEIIQTDPYVSTSNGID